MELCEIKTKDMIDELVRRGAVQRISIGLYASYDLKPKYKGIPIEANEVLVVQKVEAHPVDLE